MSASNETVKEELKYVTSQQARDLQGHCTPEIKIY
jgi:hypothetical protein